MSTGKATALIAWSHKYWRSVEHSCWHCSDM